MTPADPTPPTPPGPRPAATGEPSCPVREPASSPSSPGLPKLYGGAFAADPHPTYARLRAQGGPAHRVEIAPGVEAVLVISHRACLQVLRSPEFSKDARLWRDLAEGRIPPDHPLLPMLGWRPSMWFADGEAHRRLRASADAALARVDPHELRAHVQDTAAHLIAGFLPAGHADLVAGYAEPLPALVFARLFGTPSHLTEAMAAACRQMIDAEPAIAYQGGQQLAARLAELIAAKHGRPGRDITSWLLEHPSGLSDEETLHQLVVVIGAGTTPTTAWISSAIWMLLTEARFASGLSGGGLTTADALNEVLWLHAPLANFSATYATSPQILRDPHTGAETYVPPGMPVLIGHAAANAELGLDHDQRTSNASHLAWGAGPHTCPARDPALTIAEAAIEAVLDQLPDMTIAPGTALTWRPGPFYRALQTLPVRFAATPAPPPVTASRSAAASDGGISWTSPPPPPHAAPGLARVPSWTPPAPTTTVRPPGSASAVPPRS